MSTVLTAPPSRSSHAAPAPDEKRADLRRSTVGLLATVLTVVALFAVLRNGSWLARSLVLVAETFVVGAAARAIRVPRPVVIAVQAVVGLLLITAFQVSDWARGGFLPGVSAMRHLGRQIDDGVGDLTHLQPPVHPSFGTNAIILIAVAGAALAVDALAAGYRRPDLAAWVIPALYAIPATSLPSSWRELWFLVPAVAYLMLMIEGTGDRAARWGDSVVIERGGSKRITAVAGVAVLVLSVLIPLGLHNLPGLLKNYGIGAAPAPLQIKDPLQEMRDELVATVERPMFDHHSDSSWPGEEYLEAATLDTFDGRQWRGGLRSVDPFTGVLPAPVGIAPSIPVAPVNATVVARPGIESDFLPIPRPSTHIDIKGKWQVDPTTGDVLRTAGRGEIAGKSWTTVGLVEDPDPTTLSGSAPQDPTLARYLALPALPPEIAAQAKQITAGSKSSVEAGLKLQEFFRDATRFTYDQRPHGSGTDAIIAFLKTHRGYSEQAAATMAVMARTLGIPARLAVGWTAGKADGPDLTVTNFDAHAWPELFLPDVGWTRFEPTVGTAGSRPLPLHWLTPAKKSPPSDKPKQKHDQSPPPPPQEQPQSAPPPPAQSSGGKNSCALDPANCTHKLNPPPHGHQFPWRWVLWPMLGLLALSSPRLTRSMISRRRWADLAYGHSLAWRTSPEGAAVIARVAWLELRDHAVDLGHDWPTNRTPRQAGDALAAEITLSAAAAAELEELIASVERARYARRAGQRLEHQRLRTAVLRVRQELAAAASSQDRVRCLFLPRSLRYQIRPLRKRLAKLVPARRPLPKPRIRRRSAT